MPCNYKEYAKDWFTNIRPMILKRANDCCELCHVENKSEVFRNRKTGKWENYGNYKVINNLKNYRLTKIILTIHHIDSDKKNNDKLNLIALCQRCHLKLDMQKHVKNRYKKEKNLFDKA